MIFITRCMLPQNRTDHREGDGVSPFPLLDVSSTRDWFDCFCTSARLPAGAGISTAHQRRAPERGATVNRLEHGDMPHEPELRRRKKREAGNGGSHASMTTTVVVCSTVIGSPCQRRREIGMKLVIDVAHGSQLRVEPAAACLNYVC